MGGKGEIQIKSSVKDMGYKLKFEGRERLQLADMRTKTM